MKIGIISTEVSTIQHALIRHKHHFISKGCKQMSYYKNDLFHPFQHYQYGLGFCPCGANELSAASSTQFLIDNYDPDLIVDFGMVHKITPTPEKALIYNAKKVILHNFDVPETENAYILGAPSGCPSHEISVKNRYFDIITKNYNIPSTTCISGSDLISDSAIREKYTAEIYDTTSAGVLLTAIENKKPCLILKGILDEKSAQSFNKKTIICFQETLNILNSVAIF